jgi:hypothetical protein
VDSWLQTLLWESVVPSTLEKQTQTEIHRLKGRLVFDDGTMKMIQGVREIFEIIDGGSVKFTPGVDATSPVGKMVLIGRGIHGVDFEKSFKDSIARSS